MPLPVPVALPQADTSDSKKTRFRIPIGIILLIIYGIVLYGIAGYSIYKKNPLENSSYTEQALSDKESLQLPKFVESSGKSSSGSFEFITSMTTNKLPIVELQTNDPHAETTPSMYLSPVNVKLSDEIAKKVSAYRLGNFVFTGPKGWYGNGDVLDTGIFPFLYPTKDMDMSGPYMKIYISPKGQRVGLYIGSQYFQWIRDHASEFQMENDLAPISWVSSSSAVTKHLIMLSDTVTLGPALESYGVTFSDAEAHVQDKQWTTIYMEINLPKEQRQLAQDIVNIFIQQYDLMNK